MLKTDEYIRLNAEELGNSGTAYARLAGLLEACIWFHYTEEETQAVIDRHVSEMKEKVNA